jgi:hypothetical protein
MIDWWRRRRRGSPRVDEVRWYASHAELPESLPRHRVAVIGAPHRPKWLVLECPCGTGHRLEVNLSPSRRPFWILGLDPGPSVEPSIDLRDAHRRCHFWLLEGRVRWTPDSYAPRRTTRDAR